MSKKYFRVKNDNALPHLHHKASGDGNRIVVTHVQGLQKFTTEKMSKQQTFDVNVCRFIKATQNYHAITFYTQNTFLAFSHFLNSDTPF